MGKDGQMTLTVKKFLYNPLLARKQFILDVNHSGSSVSRATVRDKVMELFGASDANCVSVFGFKEAFGGGKATGFGLIYDSVKDFKRFEPNYRVIRAGLKTKIEMGRKGGKEKKNRMKKVRGIKKAKIGGGKK